MIEVLTARPAEGDLRILERNELPLGKEILVILYLAAIRGAAGKK